MKKGVTAEEETSLKQELAEGKEPRCPRCEEFMRSTPIRPRSDVAYVRDRVLLECRPCALRLVVDRE